MKKVNPVTVFRKANEARMGKVIKSYPKYAMGGPGDSDVLKKRASYVVDDLKLFDQSSKRKAMQKLRTRKKITKKGDLFGTSYAPGDPRKQHGVDKELFKYLKKEIKSKY